MAYDVSQLTNYVNQTANDLIRKSVIGAKTISMLTPHAGIKSAETINIMSSSLSLQIDTGSFTPGGTDTFKQVTLTVGSIKVQKEVNQKDLDSKYTQYFLKYGSNNQEYPFEEFYTDYTTALIAAANEVGIWQSSKVKSGSLYDGLLVQASGSALTLTGSFHVPATGSGGTNPISSSNIFSIFDGVVNALPSEVVYKDDLVIFVGNDIFKTYAAALRTSNFFANYPVDVKAGSFELPITGIKVQRVEGLTNTNNIFAAQLSNLHGGFDGLSDEEQFDIWYSKDFRTNRLSVSFKLGCAIGFPEQTVWFYPGQ